MRPIRGIIIHCSASKDGKALSREELVREHQARGFRTIGYHWVIEPDGTVVAGRPEAEIGAHVEGHNADTIGVCMIGTKQFSRSAWDSLEALVKRLQAAHPGATICGHRDLSPDLDHDGRVEPCEWVKLCPNFDVGAWVASGFALPAGSVIP